MQKHQVFILQEKYINTILNRFRMTECKPAQTTNEAKSVLQRSVEADKREMNKYPYQNIRGALLFLAVMRML